MGVVPLDFKPMVFAAPGSKPEMPLASFSMWSALLFNSLGLVSEGFDLGEHVLYRRLV